MPDLEHVTQARSLPDGAIDLQAADAMVRDLVRHVEGWDLDGVDLDLVPKEEPVTEPGFAAAWDELHDILPQGWYVGRPSEHPERDEWLMYAFDPSERSVAGVRSREWTAIASTEEGVVREMARCLRILADGGTPK